MVIALIIMAAANAALVAILAAQMRKAPEEKPTRKLDVTPDRLIREWLYGEE